MAVWQSSMFSLRGQGRVELLTKPRSNNRWASSYGAGFVQDSDKIQFKDIKDFQGPITAFSREQGITCVNLFQLTCHCSAHVHADC